MKKVFSLVILSLSVYTHATCPYPPEVLVLIPEESWPPECLAQTEPEFESGVITPELLERQWNAGNRARLFTLQASRLNPYSSQYMEEKFRFSLNKSFEDYDIETTEDGAQEATVISSNLYWYGKNFFVDFGSFGLEYTIQKNFEDIDKTFRFGRGIFGYRFKPIEEFQIAIGLITNDVPEVEGGVFTGDDTREIDPFITISGFGLHYAREQGNSESGVSEYTGLHHQWDDIDMELSWLRHSGGLESVEDEFTGSVRYTWLHDRYELSNSLMLTRSELVNTNSQHWSVELEYDRYTFHYLSFDDEGVLRKSDYGYGINVIITDILANKSKNKKTTKRLLRDFGIDIGVHYNNMAEYPLLAEDQLVWSLSLHGYYGD